MIALPSIPTLALTTSIPQEERTLHSVQQGWHAELLNFVQDGLPKILFAVILAAVATSLVRFFVRRMRKRADSLASINPPRAAQLRTVAGIVRASAYSLIGTYLFVQILGAVGVPLGPFVASAGVIGLGISFGAQSIFKDVLNGLFILIEDQYSVGDSVKLSGLSGTVEDLTLRITKLRDGDGTVYIVPNSQITTVSNLSRDFSVGTLKVSVNATENPDRVMSVLNHLAKSVHEGDSFQNVFMAAPQILGIDSLSGAEVIYLINLRVRANQRDGVMRELRRLILLEFQKQDIHFGASNSTLLLQGELAVPHAHETGEEQQSA
ncbi:MAG: mechanosensitive ion channel [Acidobacteriaceae bacterium]|nr:mechanosensitive ion channel [Acidobacteriaceae bacterium]